MSNMQLSDALGDWPAGGNNQSAGGGAPGAWPGSGQPAANPAWPGQPCANPTWPGALSGGGGGGAWPGAPTGGGGGGAWPGAPTGGGGGGAWPGAASGGGGGGAWPGGPAAGGGAWPGGNPSQPTAPGGWPSPSPGPGPGPGHGPAAHQECLVVPYNQSLSNGVYDKLLITIKGTIKPHADKITVDLRTDRDLAFHFNPRFNEGGKKVIVRNSCIDKKWGKEERDLSHFPFIPGQTFEMKIMCTNREFKVAVNNSHLLTFQHRITNLKSINKLSIYYDLNLSKVHMENLP